KTRSSRGLMIQRVDGRGIADGDGVVWSERTCAAEAGLMWSTMPDERAAQTTCHASADHNVQPCRATSETTRRPKRSIVRGDLRIAGTERRLFGDPHDSRCGCPGNGHRRWRRTPSASRCQPPGGWPSLSKATVLWRESSWLVRAVRHQRELLDRKVEPARS